MRGFHGLLQEGSSAWKQASMHQAVRSDKPGKPSKTTSRRCRREVCVLYSWRAKFKTCAAALLESSPGRLSGGAGACLELASLCQTAPATLKRPAKTRGKQTRKDAPPCRTLAGSCFPGFLGPEGCNTAAGPISIERLLQRLQQRGMCDHHQAESRAVSCAGHRHMGRSQVRIGATTSLLRIAAYLPGRVAIASALGIMQTASGNRYCQRLRRRPRDWPRLEPGRKFMI